MAIQPIMTKRWYQTWWGVVLSIFLVGVGLFVAVFIGITGHYLWEMKHGGIIVFLPSDSSNSTGKNSSSTVSPPQLTASGFTQATASTAPTAELGQVNRHTIEAGTNPILGSAAAPITIVEFFDFKCPYSKAAAPILQQVAAQYGKKVKIIVRDFPAESIHPGTTDLARVAYCAKQQGKYWPMNVMLFQDQDQLTDTLSDDEVSQLAASVGLNLPVLQTCLASPAALSAVTADYLAGAQAGVDGTPTFFVNGQKVEGVVPLSAWQGYLNNI